VVIVTILAALYARYGEIDALRRILAGVSCAAVGLLIAVVFRMMMPLIKKREAVGLSSWLAVFVAIGVLRLPLPRCCWWRFRSASPSPCDAAAGQA
jgi:chromate transporter